jgi:hypothetical protein
LDKNELDIAKKKAKIESIALTEKYLKQEGFEFIQENGGFVGYRDYNRTYIKIFTRFRVPGKEGEDSTFKKRDYNIHLEEMKKYACRELMYSIFISRRSSSYLVIMPYAYLKSRFTNRQTIEIKIKEIHSYESLGAIIKEI